MIYLSINKPKVKLTIGRNIFDKNLYFLSLWLSPSIIPFCKSHYYRITEVKFYVNLFKFTLKTNY